MTLTCRIWSWFRAPSRIDEARAALERAEQDQQKVGEQWPEVREARKKADRVAARVDKVYARNGFSHLFWDDMTKGR